MENHIEVEGSLDPGYGDNFAAEMSSYFQMIISGTHSPENHVEKDYLQLQEKIYDSREELLQCVRSIGLSQGYATTIKRSKKDCYVIIGCDRGGTYRNRNNVPLEERKRKTASRLRNCPFQICGRKNKDDTWRIEIKDLSHNHEKSDDISGHPYARRFSEEEVEQIKEMTMAGIPPRQILTSLRLKGSELRSIARTLYNTRAKIIKESLAGRTAIQALLEELGEGGFLYNVEYDQDHHLTHLFFAHPISITLSRSYPTIFVMDCTYKTNRYKMPLLDIIGVSSFNTSFYSCFVFLQREEENDYVWALTMFKKMLGGDICPSVVVSDRELSLMNAIKVVFPSAANLLCVWHIEKNILANCKRHFEKANDWNMFLSTWTDLMDSPNETSFYEGWNRFCCQYARYPQVLNYLMNTWFPHKEKFVSAWTDKYTHFGNRVTSRAEGAHATLKRYLQVSTGDLRIVKDKICHAITNQFQEIKARISSERIRVPHKLRIPYLKNLVNCVSEFALEELLRQHDLAFSESLSTVCKGHFSKTMGLPCAHQIREKKIEILELDDIHLQWRIDKRSFSRLDKGLEDQEQQWGKLLEGLDSKYKLLPLTQKEDVQKQLTQFVFASDPLILEPQVQPHKGFSLCSRKRKGTNSTKHDPSAFEREENTNKCSICRDGGHNCRTCPRRTMYATTSSSLKENGINTLPSSFINTSIILRENCSSRSSFIDGFDSLGEDDRRLSTSFCRDTSLEDF